MGINKRREELQGGGLICPACHARHENIWKEQVVGIVQGMMKMQGGKARAGRSSGGDKAGLLGLKKEDRDPPDSPEAPDGGRGKSDQRILGSGSFVSTTLQQSERLLEKKYKPKRTIDDLIAAVADKGGSSPELICSGSRQKKIAEARALVAYLAVEETGHSAADVARYLGIGRTNVLRSIKRGREI